METPPLSMILRLSSKGFNIASSRLLKEKGVEEYINAANHFKNNKSLKFTLLGSHKSEKSYISKVILEKSDLVLLDLLMPKKT